MKFTITALAAFAATVVAQTSDFNPVFQPEENEVVAAGEPFEITWEAPEKYAAGTVSLHLIGGADQDHQLPIADLAAGIPNSAEKFSWDVDASLGDAAVYGLVIKYESDPEIYQYSNPFQIEKAEGAEDDSTTTVSKDYGTKTVTLSEQEETSTVTPPTVETTSEYTPTPTPTTTVEKPTTIKTKPAPTNTAPVVEDDDDEETAPAPTTIAEDAGVRFSVSSVALVGAFVVAALSL